jgi:hypothetical protein
VMHLMAVDQEVLGWKVGQEAPQILPTACCI